VSDVHLIKAGDKVGASEAALLGKLGVKPFKYGLEVVKVYDSGSLFEPAVLEITGAWRTRTHMLCSLVALADCLVLQDEVRYSLATRVRLTTRRRLLSVARSRY
jgi:large subunit ribosomal protein LP0